MFPHSVQATFWFKISVWYVFRCAVNPITAFPQISHTFGFQALPPVLALKKSVEYYTRRITFKYNLNKPESTGNLKWILKKLFFSFIIFAQKIEVTFFGTN